MLQHGELLLMLLAKVAAMQLQPPSQESSISFEVDRHLPGAG